MTKPGRHESETTLAALVYLGRAAMALCIPIRTAESWIRPADLFEFADEVEKRVRELLEFIDSNLSNNPGALQRGIDPGTALAITNELDEVRRNLEAVALLRSRRNRAKADFSAEAEELRKLRSGELRP